MTIGISKWMLALATGCTLSLASTSLGSNQGRVTPQANPAPKAAAPARALPAPAGLAQATATPGKTGDPELDALVRYWTSDAGIARLQELCQNAMQAKSASGLPFSTTPYPASGGPGVTGSTDFEEEAEPAAFSGTYPLLGARGGLTFLNTGWDGLDFNGGNGGAVLNAGYDAGVLPYSGSNFLAFNSGANYPNGVSVPVPPNVVFGPPSQIMGGFFSGGYDSEQVVMLGFSDAGLTGFRMFDTLAGDWELKFVGTGGTQFSAVLILGGTEAGWSVVADDLFGYNF
ncbi:MAG: hypothetical protein QF903_10045 [Planctomycetota bacterium]|jgi:hypothetical protein|nr:hypothetical protein [Planctomycetota bacterium]MDP6989807.1 hypothetical protein [Planctomycetota bacterium]